MDSRIEKLQKITADFFFQADSAKPRPGCSAASATGLKLCCVHTFMCLKSILLWNMRTTRPGLTVLIPKVSNWTISVC